MVVARPLSVIFALVASLLAAVSIGQLSRHMPTAGSFYTYVSNGLHPALGFLVAWGFLLGILVGGPFLALQMGFVVAGTTNAEWGWSPDLWWVWTVLVCLLVFWLGYRGIKASTKTGILLGAFEILVFVALSLTLIVQAGSDNTLEVFGTHYANNVDYSGFSGVIVGSIYTILAFIGFEEAAPIAEEAHDAASDGQPGDHLLLPRDRRLLPPQHLRQQHHVRTGADDRLRRRR